MFARKFHAVSQSYYYGSIKQNPARRVEDFDGDFIDLRNDLDVGKAELNGATSANGLDELMRRDTGRGVVVEPPSEWQQLNSAALANLSAWVPALFGDKARRKASGDYRVSSKDLGRNFQEDLDHVEGH